MVSAKMAIRIKTVTDWVTAVLLLLMGLPIGRNVKKLFIQVGCEELLVPVRLALMFACFY